LNFNFDQNFRPIFAFHDDNYCPGPDLQHDWQGSHMDANFSILRQRSFSRSMTALRPLPEDADFEAKKLIQKAKTKIVRSK
jgi:hypothetical protein